jgi:hypothetical protein
MGDEETAPGEMTVLGTTPTPKDSRGQLLPPQLLLGLFPQLLRHLDGAWDWPLSDPQQAARRR